MPIQNRIAEFEADITAWRRDLHRHPELAFAEHRTTAMIRANLNEFGVDEVLTGFASVIGLGPSSRLYRPEPQHLGPSPTRIGEGRAAQPEARRKAALSLKRR